MNFSGNILFRSLLSLLASVSVILGWREHGWLWLAGKRTNGIWRWYGKTTGQILVADWEQVQPDGGDNFCLQVFDRRRANSRKVWENYRWDDTPCGKSQNFVCEKLF